MAILVTALAGCQESSGPLSVPEVEGPRLGAAGSVPILEQSSSAAPLETYRVSFWAYRGKSTDVTVGYQGGAPFLRFWVPKEALLGGADGRPLIKGDSVYLTLTIDPVYFQVDFQPSGVKFSVKAPAVVTFWYANANRDLSGNGVVDGNDQHRLEQLAIHYIASGAGSRLPSKNDKEAQTVSAPLLHFSQYAVSW